MDTQSQRKELRKVLNKFKNMKNVRFLIDELFQKDPEILAEVNNSKLFDTSIKDLKPTLKFVEDKIMSNVSSSKTKGLPQKFASYVFFMDLILFYLDKSSRNKWFTFALKNYRHSASTKSELSRMRRNVRKNLPKSNITSVQQFITPFPEAKNNAKGDVYKSIFRILSFEFPNSIKNKPERMERRSLSWRPVYIVYFSNHPYFYSTSKDINGAVLDAFVESCDSSSSSPVDFSSTDLNSLYYVKEGCSKSTAEESADKLPGNQTAISVSDKRIILKEVFLHSISEFKKNDVIISSNQTPIKKKFEIALRISGDDVLAGIKQLQRDGLLDDEKSNWANYISTAGKNHLLLKSRNVKEGESPFEYCEEKKLNWNSPFSNG